MFEFNINKREHSPMTLALTNGRIYTLDENNTIVDSILIEDEKIKVTGSTQDVEESVDGSHQTIDLHGKTVLPGFVDGHTHLGHSGLESLWVDLSDTESTDEILERIKKRTATTQPGEWIVGVMYDDSGWRIQECLTKYSLDSISTTHPIFLRRVCGHYGVVNSNALEHIDGSWRFVDRDTGILLEDSVLGFMKIIKPDHSMRLSGMQKMLPKVCSLGITTVREVVNFHSIKAYLELDAKSLLKVRIFGYILHDDLDEFKTEYPNGLQESKNFKLVGVKILLDGSLGGRTAALVEPYNDDPGNTGKLLHTDAEVKSIFKQTKSLGLSLMAHAIGDRAIRQFIDIYREVFRDDIPENPKGHSLEHVEVLNDGLLVELKDLGVWLSMQPNFAGRWSIPGGLNEVRLGRERLKWCNAYKSVLDNGLPMVFGSDSMPLDPLFGIESALSHPVQEQRITPEQAIRGYTQSAYNLLGIDTMFGSITPGKIADLVILTADPVAEMDFDKIQVVGTICNGELVYNKGL
jgi:predicted amidohydrolase YtcJ